MAIVALSFGANRRVGDEITGGWVEGQIRNRDADGVHVCGLLEVARRDCETRLRIGKCPTGRGTGINTACQQEVIDLWRKLHLDGEAFTPGNLIAFVRHAGRLD